MDIFSSIRAFNLLFIVSVVPLWCASGAWAQQNTESPADVVRSVVTRWIERYEPPGVMVVVRREGKTEFFPFGKAHPARGVPVEPDSIFELASITKSFTATS